MDAPARHGRPRAAEGLLLRRGRGASRVPWSSGAGPVASEREVHRFQQLSFPLRIMGMHRFRLSRADPESLSESRVVVVQVGILHLPWIGMRESV